MTQMNLSLKQKWIHRHREQICVTKGRRGGLDGEFGVSRCKVLHLEWMDNKVLLYIAGNYIQSPGINQNETECTYVCVCVYTYIRMYMYTHNCHCKRRRFNPGLGRCPGEGDGNLLQKSHGQRSLAGYSPWDHKGLDMTQQLINNSLSIYIYIYTHIYVYIYYVTEALDVQQKLIQQCKSTIISIKKKTCFSSSHSSTTIDPIFSFANLTLYSSYTSRHLFQISHS